MATSNRTVRVLVVCADGAATSTVVSVRLREYFENKGLRAEVVQGRVVDAKTIVENSKFDLVVSTAGSNLGITNVPVLNGVPLLTGIGKDQFYTQLDRIIQQS